MLIETDKLFLLLNLAIENLQKINKHFDNMFKNNTY